MKTMVLTLFTVLLLQACGNNSTSDNLLSAAPYKALTDSIQESPENADLYYRRGVILYKNNQFPHAQSDLQRAWELAPNEQHALSLATILSKKHSDTAHLFLQRASEKLPQSVALKINLAKSWQEKGNVAEAMKITESVLSHYPNSIDALLLKAELLKANNNHTAALQALERAYNLSPFDAELVHNLAFEYAQSKNKRALVLADSLIRADINALHAEPYYFKGIYYESVGNHTEAIKQLDEAIKHDYYFLDAHMEKGQIFYNQKKYNEALKAFQLAITITPTFADAYFWLGKTKEALGQKAEAKMDYQRAYGLDKSMTEAKQAADKL